MAGVNEKARFYLERAVPQLREWEEKEIFSKDEIRTIVQKRNDFEHKVLSPGNKAHDWSSYAQWEESLESLRSKRCKRLKIRHLNSAHAGQGRTLAIFERGVSRHQGSGELWREYLAYAARVKAAKRWRRTMTNALRMMPTDPELWVMAGRRSAQNGDMAAARGFFMRGCRFCTTDHRLWLEYARSEMEWLEKVDKRKETKKGGDALRPDRVDDDDELRIVDSDDEDEDGTMLPEPSDTQAKIIDKKSAQQLESNPAMDGAIPMAIFDISKKQGFFNAEVAETFFDMFASFTSVSVQPRISQHVLDTLDQEYPNHPSTCNIHIRQPIIGVSPVTADFPKNLREVLTRLSKYLEATTDRAELQKKTAAWIDGYLALKNLDEGIQAVLKHTKNKVAVP
ncbi:U3 small nucleolar RNA-associated protein 6-domain-containing protein [Dactylonectria macrodidyma]|uniref:U3 small nucleolar RNA-associated protein 6-domain-containing protein n=1 Tax=Dactylonectria macrodidyma TaxID=307937 RepID=A0A9P9F9Y5_9HYPO|nr:U3 small nucleolar RNA-associated protein 6-domain-containing protein [Dactylonectria macrodidyma]